MDKDEGEIKDLKQWPCFLCDVCSLAQAAPRVPKSMARDY